MLFKQSSFDIKDLDENKGIVVAYANVYNFEDSDGDISSPGSFTKTAKENIKRVRVLKDHNPRIGLGVPLELNTKDPYGLLTTTQFNLEKEVSRDMFSDIKLMTKHNLNAELSIGYDVIKRNKANRKQIDEYKLYEYSFLTSWAANELSTVQGIKSLNDMQGVLELLTKMYNLDYSDTRLKQIENVLKSLDKEPLDDTLNDEPIKDAIKQSFTNFKLN